MCLCGHSHVGAVGASGVRVKVTEATESMATDSAKHVYLSSIASDHFTSRSTIEIDQALLQLQVI